ncbi:FadR family transcriptional regulator [Cellulosimicrobium cellulans]|uniref:FadR/GntR family transcriptional regulator n=1 Tax=Cellulosimicrobium cellulans TaxID=1710 RepID=UPI00214A783D|nr:FadR family transcriptional regulator [Cellulosimicrobium cellulans]
MPEPDATLPTSGIVRQRRLSDQVADAIRDDILARELQPGDRLPSERELCESYGVSRTVVREAVRALTAKGIVTATPGSGLNVGRTSIDDVGQMLQMFLHHGPNVPYLQLHEVRATLEVAVAGIAAERIDDGALTGLADLVDQLPGHADDIVAASKNDYAFHRGLAVATGNDFFVMLYDVLGEGLMETRIATFSYDPRRIDVVTRAHRAIVDNLDAHRADGARAAMLDHLTEVRETWVRHQDGAPA